jgi:hypothetical protein
MLRNSPKLVDRMAERSQRQREKMKPIKKLVDAYDAENWSLISEKLKKKLRIYESTRAGHQNLKDIGEIELKMILAREDEIKAILNHHEDAKAILSAMQEEHDKLLAKIREKRRTG